MPQRCAPFGDHNSSLRVRLWRLATGQVDDLEEIGNLEGYIERTSVILIYCSKGYFQSRNCIREFVATVAMKKPIIALIDPEVSHGGLSIQEVRTQLTETDEIAITKWGFKEHQDHQRTVLEWHGVYEWPGSQKLYDALFANETIEWNRARHEVFIHMLHASSCADPPCPLSSQASASSKT